MRLKNFWIVDSGQRKGRHEKTDDFEGVAVIGANQVKDLTLGVSEKRCRY